VKRFRQLIVELAHIEEQPCVFISIALPSMICARLPQLVTPFMNPDGNLAIFKSSLLHSGDDFLELKIESGHSRKGRRRCSIFRRRKTENEACCQYFSLLMLNLGRHGSCKIAHGEPLTDRGSIFVAHLLWPILSEVQARAAIAMLANTPEASSADHNMSAFRLREPKPKTNKITKAGNISSPSSKASSLPKTILKRGSDDDGEARGGGAIAGMLQREDALGVAVVVSRWFGGENLGKVRFQHIAGSARDLLLKKGHERGIALGSSESDWGRGNVLRTNSGGSGSGSGSGSSSGSGSGGEAKRGKKRPLNDIRAAMRETIAAAAEQRRLKSSAAPAVPNPSRLHNNKGEEESESTRKRQQLLEPTSAPVPKLSRVHNNKGEEEESERTCKRQRLLAPTFFPLPSAVINLS
jgi:hypothetical protein